MRRRRVIWAITLAIPGTLLNLSAALAGDAEHPANYATTWKPTQVDIFLSKIADTDKWVFEGLEWTTDFSMSRIDAPRTGEGDGTYEHELRFRQLPGGSSNHWCENDWSPWSIITNFPGTYWYDNFGIDNDSQTDEFTWGFHTEDVVEDQRYTLSFHCRPNANVNESNHFTYQGQIGHCHHWPPTGCGENTAFGDRTVTYIPRYLSSVDGTTNVSITFGGNPGFENGQGPWAMFNETAGSGVLCNGPSPLQGDCYIFLNPANSNSNVRMRTIHDVGSAPVAEGGDVYTEFWVRCPTQWNSSDCQVRLHVEPLNNQNSPVGSSWASSWITIPENDGFWYGVQIHNHTVPFPNGTKKWNFLFEVSLNHAVDVDLHQQWYHDGW
jgi:hypothetical protein